MPIKRLQRLRFQDGLSIAFGSMLFLIIIGILYVLAYPPAQTPNIPSGKNIQPTSMQTPSLSPNLGDNQIMYDTHSVTVLLDKLKNPVPLSDDDKTAKERIIAAIPQNQESGTLYQTNNMYISYIRPADKIYVVILTKEINQAKSEANIWFRSKGLSQKAICDHPVMFYPSQQLREYLKGTQIIFSLSPNGC